MKPLTAIIIAVLFGYLVGLATGFIAFKQKCDDHRVYEDFTETCITRNSD